MTITRSYGDRSEYRRVEFADASGAECTIENSPNPDGRDFILIGIDGDRMFLDRTAAAELARMLAEFSETGCFSSPVAARQSEPANA